jgi:hypothetical protein
VADDISQKNFWIVVEAIVAKAFASIHLEKYLAATKALDQLCPFLIFLRAMLDGLAGNDEGCLWSFLHMFGSCHIFAQILSCPKLPSTSKILDEIFFQQSSRANV